MQDCPLIDRLIFALDVPDAAGAVELARTLEGHVGYFKIGLQLFIQCGPAIIHDIAGFGKIFLDLKLHDIPATMRGAIRAVPKGRVSLLTVHASNSPDALKEAAAAAGAAGDMKIIAVTVLTSISVKDLEDMGVGLSPSEAALERAVMAQGCGCAGVVCSALEAAQIRLKCGRDFLIITPGIRPSWEGVGMDDQKRVATPADAMKRGADMIVVGRAIRDSSDPAGAADGVLEEIEAGLEK